MALYRLIYISSGYTKFAMDELRAIIDVSVKNNAAVDVTGMLLYLDGNFLQLLEGKPDDVEAVYDRILRDSRHSGAMVLSRADVAERLFPDWAMGLKNIDPEKDTDIADLFELDRDTILAKLGGAEGALAKKMVDTFISVNA